MNPLYTSIVAISMLAVSAPTPAASQRMEDGRKAYENICAQCHESGMGGAPRTRNIEDWGDRSNLWEGVLFEHAEKGYLHMPPRGGDEDASNYAVEAAAEYMLTITHPNRPRD